MAMQLFLVMVPLYLVLGWIATTWIRAKHGYPLAGGVERRDRRKDERDALLSRLEDRVRVLERIATDRPTQLSAELDALRAERPGAQGQGEGDRSRNRSRNRD